MDNPDPILARVGTFFMVMGGGAFILFVTSDLADQVDFDYLFIAMLLIGIGWVFRRRKAPPPPAGRFSGIKGVFRKNQKGQGGSVAPPTSDEE
ncbi:MAG: hypothetical protein QY332_12755 [Anaerolineales bacterium]|nr:MAG: hypothetical protein QY332_12755 [Anaerolineales bacterium]